MLDLQVGRLSHLLVIVSPFRSSRFVSIIRNTAVAFNKPLQTSASKFQDQQPLVILGIVYVNPRMMNRIVA